MEASLLAIMGYIIPFVFVYNPALILQGPALDIVATFLLMVIVAALWSATFSGYFFTGINRTTRFVMGAVTVLLVCVASNIWIMGQLVFQVIIIVSSLSAMILFHFLNKKVKSQMTERASVPAV